jgi:hypothetical protein
MAATLPLFNEAITSALYGENVLGDAPPPLEGPLRNGAGRQ